MSYEGAALLVAVVAVAVALGAGLRRLFTPRAERTVESLVVDGALGWAVLSWWGVLLAEAGQFTPGIFLAPAGLLAVALWTVPRSDRSGGWRIDAAALAALALVAVVAGSLFFPVFDVQLEARDPGTYFHAGRQLARHGEINFVDPTVTGLGPETRAAMFPPVGGHERAFHNSRYPGFYLETLESGRVVPQAAPVFTVWVGVGYWVGGDRGALGTGAVLMAIGAALLSLLGAAYAGRVGLAAGPLFAAGFVPVWFAKYSAAEAAALVAVLLGCLGMACYRQDGDRFHALAAALGFGLAPLAKAELLVIFFPLAAILFVDVVTRRLSTRDFVYLWLPLGLLGAHLVVHATGWLWPYYFDVARQYSPTPIGLYAIGTGAALLGILVTVLVRYLVAGRVESIRAFVRGDNPAGRVVRWLGAGAAVALTAYGYWGRPYFFRADPTSGGWNMANHVDLGFAISPWFVLLAAVGMALLIGGAYERRGFALAAFVLMIMAAQILFERNIIPSTMWAYRRYVPIVLPLHYLTAVVAIGWIGTRLSRWRVPAVAVWAVLLAPGVWHHATVGAHIKEHEELPGAAAALAQLAEVAGPEDAVLFETRTRRGLIRFEAALGLDGAPAVYRLPDAELDRDAVRSIANDRLRNGGEVYLVTTGYLDGLVGIGAEPVAMLEWATVSLEEVTSHFTYPGGEPIRLPDRVVPLEFEARIYRLDPAGTLTPLTERLVGDEIRGELDVGLWDEPYIIGSLMDVPEYSEIHNFRWTTGQAEFLLPGIPANAETVILRVAPNENLPSQDVEAWLDDIYLGSAPVPAGWTDVRLAIPPGWQVPEGGTARLRITTPAVRPAEVDPTSTDRRTLGIRVDKVFWARAQPTGER